MRRAALVFLLHPGGAAALRHAQDRPADQFLRPGSPCPSRAWIASRTSSISLVPFDAAKGEEGVTAQGVILIGLLALIGLSSWKGIEQHPRGFQPLDVGCAGPGGADPADRCPGHGAARRRAGYPVHGQVLRRAAGAGRCWAGCCANSLSEDEQRDFLWESWRFVKQIFPLLIVGVFTVGVIRVLIQPGVDRSPGGREYAAGQPGGRGLWRVHVLPHPGGGADRQDVPQPGHAPRPAAGLPDGRPGAEPAEHPDHRHHHRDD